MSEQKPKKKFGGKQEGAGRPKTIISPEDMKKAEKFARKGHQTGTICELMGWDREWADQRGDILTRLTKMRAWHKDDIRTDQERIRKADDKGLSAAATMAIFQGKNELGQSDRIEAEVITRILSVEGLQAIGDVQRPE